MSHPTNAAKLFASGPSRKVRGASTFAGPKKPTESKLKSWAYTIGRLDAKRLNALPYGVIQAQRVKRLQLLGPRGPFDRFGIGRGIRSNR